jgi:hypothetical protein
MDDGPCVRREHPEHGCDIDTGRSPQGPHQRPTPHGEFEALQIAMHIGTATRQPGRVIGDARIPDENHPEQG